MKMTLFYRLYVMPPLKNGGHYRLLLIFLGTAFLVSKKWGWLLLVLLFISGLVSRRFGDINELKSLNLPLNYIIPFAVYLFGGAILLFLNKREKKPDYLKCHIFLIIPLIIYLLPLSILGKLVPMILLLFSAVYFFRKNLPAHILMFAYWMSFYYLSTSSDRHFLSLWLTFMIIFTGIYLLKSSSCSMKGIICSLMIYELYIIPGNTFGLKLPELFDPYIMSICNDSQISAVIFIIASRYILPLVIILYLMRLSSCEPTSILPSAYISLIPAIAVTGIAFSNIIYTGTKFFPWTNIQHFSFFGVYFLFVVAGIFIYGVICRIPEHSQ